MHKQTYAIEEDDRDDKMLWPIPDGELPEVKRMSSKDRKAWLGQSVKKNRNRAKAARKARRRNRR